MSDIRIKSIRANEMRVDGWPGFPGSELWVDEAHHWPVNPPELGLKVGDWVEGFILPDGRLTIETGAKATPYDPLKWGRMEVRGKLTAYFVDEALMRRAMRPTGHWCSYPRKYKRQYRRAWQERHKLPKRRSKGWRRHVRAAKAKRRD